MDKKEERVRHYRLFYVYKCVIFMLRGLFKFFPITSRLKAENKKRKKSIQVFKYFRRCLEASVCCWQFSLKNRGWIVCVKQKKESFALEKMKIENKTERSFGHLMRVFFRKCIKWSHRVIFPEHICTHALYF